MKKHLLTVIIITLGLSNVYSQWVEQASGFYIPSRGIRDICAVDTNVVWAIGYDGSGAGEEIQEFTRTTNGGSVWVSNTVAGFPDWGFAMIHAIDSMNAWIPTWSPSGGGAIIHTSNGGVSWSAQTTAVFSAPNGFPNVVYFWDANNGFCMGDPNGGYFELYTTTNGGSTWTRVPQNDIPANLSQEFGIVGYFDVVGDIIWFTTNKGRVYKSIDKGYHWTVSQTPITSKTMEISFANANYGIVHTPEENYEAFYTTDGGTTWQQLSYSGNFYANDFCYIPGTISTFISVGADISNAFSGISYSDDGGLTWTQYINSDTNQFLAVDFVDNTHGWAGSFNISVDTAGMYKYTGSEYIYDSCAGFAASFTKSASNIDIYVSGLVDFTDLSSGYPTQWAWDFGDGGSSSSQNPGYTYTAAGNYLIELTITKGSCISVFTDSITVINSSGIESFYNETDVRIWPNPANESLNISSERIINYISIYNSLGQKVKEAEGNFKSLTINIKDLPHGMYYILIPQPGSIIKGSFTIAR